jgi:uncharacterized protein
VAAAIAYLDSSALVKLIVEEPQTARLSAAISSWPQRASSVLAEVEVLRAVARAAGGEPVLRRAEELLARMHLVELDAGLRRSAAALDRHMLRTLDAIHLASAMSLGTDLATFVAYDRRLFDAALAAGLPAVAPGAD